MSKYVLGTATVTNAPWRMQRTCKGDSFYTLASAYGVPAAKIPTMQPGLQGKSITKKSVQVWLKNLPGWSRADGMRPYSKTDNPGTLDPFGMPEGYAQFTDNTQILLPDMPRLDGKSPGGGLERSPAGRGVVSEPIAESGVGPWILVGGGLSLVALLLLRKKAKKSKQGAAKAA